MGRAENISSIPPQLWADVTLYPPSEGGRKKVAYPGWGCPCCVSNMEPVVGYDGFPKLGDSPLEPGTRKRLSFVFLSPEAADIMTNAGRFYLWEGQFIGEAIVVPRDVSTPD